MEGGTLELHEHRPRLGPGPRVCLVGGAGLSTGASRLGGGDKGSRVLFKYV